MAKPIKPETTPRGTHTPYLWMTSHHYDPQGGKAGLAVISRGGYPMELGLKKSDGAARDPEDRAHTSDTASKLVNLAICR